MLRPVLCVALVTLEHFAWSWQCQRLTVSRADAETQCTKNPGSIGEAYDQSQLLSHKAYCPNASPPSQQFVGALSLSECVPSNSQSGHPGDNPSTAAATGYCGTDCFTAAATLAEMAVSNPDWLDAGAFSCADGINADGVLLQGKCFSWAAPHLYDGINGCVPTTKPTTYPFTRSCMKAYVDRAGTKSVLLMKKRAVCEHNSESNTTCSVYKEGLCVGMPQDYFDSIWSKDKQGMYDAVTKAQEYLRKSRVCSVVTAPNNATNTTSNSEGVYSFGGEIGQDHWKLVRRVKAGTKWHPATDAFAGTDVYGDYDPWYQSDKTFSIAFNTCERFLVASGDMSVWFIATKDAIAGSFYGGAKRDIIRSSSSSSAYQASWYRRSAFADAEDPWLSTEDHGCSACMVYGENNHTAHATLVNNNDGANVFCQVAHYRDDLNGLVPSTCSCPTDATCQDTAFAAECSSSCPTQYLRSQGWQDAALKTEYMCSDAVPVVISATETHSWPEKSFGEDKITVF